MNGHTTRRLGAAIALGALLLVGVTAAFAANGSASTFFGRIMRGSGQSGMMSGSGTGSMMSGNGYRGMMNGHATGGMMSESYSTEMMSGWTKSNGKTISLEQAQQSVQRYIDQIGNPNLAIDEVIKFQRNFYAVVKDTSTGRGAFEVLVNKSTGAVMLEPGPAMMWNTQYGMMSGGMGGMMGYQHPAGPMTVSTAKAEQIAQQWLAQNRPGATTETPDQFPGYYTIHFLQSGKVAGMLSVNGYTGQVWYHNWHSKAIRVLEVGG